MSTVDRAVDPTTGTLGCSLNSPIPSSCFDRASTVGRALLLETKPGALLVQQRAVQELQNLYSVAVVGGDNKVAFRNVKVGQRVDVAVGDRGRASSRASESLSKAFSESATA